MAYEPAMPPPGRVAGFYIATNSLLDLEAGGADRRYKVGQSADLARRLTDSAYATCWRTEWHFAATFETTRPADAAALEAAVLDRATARRPPFGAPAREVVDASLDELLAAARGSAAALGVAVVERLAPAYVRPVVDTPPDDGHDFGTGPAARAAATLWARRADAVRLAVGALAPVAPAVMPVELGPELGDDEDAPIDIDLAADDELDVPSGEPGLELRPYQLEAVTAGCAQLARAGRAVMQLACRCGKTPIAFEFVRRALAGQPLGQPLASVSRVALVLVPGLALLAQTAAKFASYGCRARLLAVGSDPRPVPYPGGASCTPMTTDAAAVADAVASAVRDGSELLVICTYQSSPLLPRGAPWAVAVFDEAHRTCGGRAPRPFSDALLSPGGAAASGAPCLFLTATPALGGDPARVVTMSDRGLFGETAYRYHLRRGIDSGFVNDFRIEVIAVGGAGAADSAPTLTELAECVVEAASRATKLLVFCRSIRHAADLHAATAALYAATAALCATAAPPRLLLAHSRQPAGGAAAALAALRAPGAAVLFNCRLFQEGVEIPDLNAVMFASPRGSAVDIVQSVCRPLNHLPGKPASRVFLPVALDPRAAPGAPANLARFAAVVPVIDALLAEDPTLFERLLDQRGARGAIDGGATASFRRAAVAAPEGHLSAAVAAAARVAARGGDGEGAPRLLRSAVLPWAAVFGELRRVVTECRRYPKGTDAWAVGDTHVPLHRFYRRAADAYVDRQAGRPTWLEPWQAAELESLPGWAPYGIEGPYPWAECMATLDAWLAAHGRPPPLEINTGGFVGLGATPLERLAGAMTCVNQGDGCPSAVRTEAADERRAARAALPRDVLNDALNDAREELSATTASGRVPGFTVAPSRAADLDRVCAKYGLVWRKARDAVGRLLPIKTPQTFIQKANSEFKTKWMRVSEYYTDIDGDIPRADPAGLPVEVPAHIAADRAFFAAHFPGYPRKHRKQEHLDVVSAPPRLRHVRAAAEGRGPLAAAMDAASVGVAVPKKRGRPPARTNTRQRETNAGGE